MNQHPCPSTRDLFHSQQIRHALLNDSTDKALERSLFYFRDPHQPNKALDQRDVVLKSKLDSLKSEIKSAGARVYQYKEYVSATSCTGLVFTKSATQPLRDGSQDGRSS